MSAVDVLAVMEFAASDLAVAQEAFSRGDTMDGLDKASARLQEARAAVAELVEAAKLAQAAMSTPDRIEPRHRERLRAALARMGGKP